MFINWQPTPCVECARAVAQAGISAVIGPNRPFHENDEGKKERWLKSCSAGVEKLEEVGVKLWVFDDEGDSATIEAFDLERHFLQS
jgi:deoxycytidylate deaminase